MKIKELLPAVVNGRSVLAAIMNNQVVSLDDEAVAGAKLDPLTLADQKGFEVYRNTLVPLLGRCAAEIFPSANFRVRHSLGSSLWCTLEGVGVPMPEVAERLSVALKMLVAADEPIVTRSYTYQLAVEMFRKYGRLDEANLLMHRNSPTVQISACGGFFALSQSPLVPRTGLLDKFELSTMDGGLVLSMPTPESPDAVVRPTDVAPYFEVFRRQVARTDITGVETVGDLNQCILDGHFPALVRTIEALHTRELSDIARQICERQPAVKLVLLAGPSSSGKTTTAHRLCTQLRVHGVKPMLLSTDDYFVGDARNPVDENGHPDWETIKAVDVERLTADLKALFAGEAVRLRKFDFKMHDGYDAATESRLPAGGVVVLEGIHALNPDLTPDIADELKFRIYLNAMTQLVLDSCNRISASDTRLLRRLVRDHRFRGLSPLRTFELWPNVVAGERKWIYPYQNHADAVFNSALGYELAVLKPFALELLNQVKPWDHAYLEARRLQLMLENVSLASDKAVPGDSILRETIGGSQLDY